MNLLVVVWIANSVFGPRNLHVIIMAERLAVIILLPVALVYPIIFSFYYIFKLHGLPNFQWENVWCMVRCRGDWTVSACPYVPYAIYGRYLKHLSLTYVTDCKCWHNDRCMKNKIEWSSEDICMQYEDRPENKFSVT